MHSRDEGFGLSPGTLHLGGLVGEGATAELTKNEWPGRLRENQASVLAGRWEEEVSRRTQEEEEWSTSSKLLGGYRRLTIDFGSLMSSVRAT